VDVTGYLSGSHIRTASHLQRTSIAIEFGGAVAEHVAVVYGAGGVQHFVIGTNVDAAPSVPAEVTARKGAVIALACVANWNMWSNPAANQPAEETARSISGVGSKALRLQTKATFGSIEHSLCGFDLVIGARGCWFNVDNDCVLEIDEIVEPVSELQRLLAFAVQADDGSEGEITFGGLRSGAAVGFPSEPPPRLSLPSWSWVSASSPARYSATARFGA